MSSLQEFLLGVRSLSLSPMYNQMFIRFAVFAIVLFLSVARTSAQDFDPLRITLSEAIEIALVNNYALQTNRLTEKDARLQIAAAIGVAFPTVEGASSYTRNIKDANPFAGSSAGDLFSGFAFIDWLGFNEAARTDGSNLTNPITLAEFADRQRRGMEAAGIIPADPSDNPFSVANQYLNSVTITQKILDAPNWARVLHPDGYKTALKRVAKVAERQEQIVIGQVREAFYGALLAEEEARVASQSVERTRTSRNETALRVSRGILPKMDRLTMDVQLANQETNLIQAQTRASNSLDQLKYLLGLPAEQEIALNGALEINEMSPYLYASAADAFSDALKERPDLEEAQLAYKFSLNELRANKLSRFPTFDVFANLSYSGRVPDNRMYTIADPSNPFSFSQGTNTYFSTAYWQSAVSVGFNLRWTILDGFQRKRTIQRAEVAARQAGVNLEQINASARMEIDMALRSLNTAYHQIGSQETNVANAELNYQYTLARSNEGVANTLQVRAASEQLDTSKLNYLRAVHSFLIAQSALEVAMGIPIEKQTDIQLASADM